jgi:hypothetical protein
MIWRNDPTPISFKTDKTIITVLSKGFRATSPLRFALTRQKDVSSFDVFQELLVVHKRSEWCGGVECVIWSQTCHTRVEPRKYPKSDLLGRFMWFREKNFLPLLRPKFWSIFRFNWGFLMNSPIIRYSGLNIFQQTQCLTQIQKSSLFLFVQPSNS